MQKKFFKLIALITFSLSVVSCGDLFMKKKSDSDSISTDALSCELDAKALSNIFTTNIKGDLLCLKESLDLFVEVVKTDKPGYLSQVELDRYIRDNVSDIDVEVLSALSGIFDINSLIFGDHPLYIHKSNVGKLVDIFIEINRAMVANNVFNYYTDETPVSYKEHNRRKAMVYEALSSIGGKIIETSVENSRSINFPALLEKFKNLDNNIVLQNSMKFLFIKKMFLGGEEEVLTSKELRRFAGMLSDVSKVTFDIAHIDTIEHAENEAEEILQTAKVDVQTIVKNLYYKGQDYTNVMSMRNIYDIIDTFLPEYSKWKKYTSDYLKAKKALLENDSEDFNSNEVYILLNDIVLENLNRGVFIYKAYALNEDILNSGDTIIEDLPNMINLSDSEDKYKNEMNNIVKSYRFFKGDTFAGTYQNSIVRNPLGIFEISVYENLIKRILSVYGSTSMSALGGAKITQEQLVATAMEYKDILVGEEILIAGREKNTIETVTLMSSLFQAQSDGDSDIEVNELVEFVIELSSGGNLAQMSHEYFQTKCSLDEKDRYMPECYRSIFNGVLDVEDKGVSIRDKLPKLAAFLEQDNVDAGEYLRVAEGFTRSCTHFDDGTPVPMTEDELSLIYTGVIAVEQTMVRYDVNNNNQLEPEEVDKAYEVYEGSIKGLIPGKFLQKFAKSFYLYLMKYKKLPDVQDIKSTKDLWRALKEGSHFVGFLFKSKKKKQTSADRFTIATILKTLSELSPENISNPFPCETLR